MALIRSFMKAKEGTNRILRTNLATYSVNRLHFGKGSFATVHLATDEKGRNVVAKKIRRESLKVEHLEKDLDRLLEMRHPNVVRMFDKYFEDDSIWILMEYCPEKDLNQFLKGKTLPVKVKVDTIFIPLGDGIKYLHDNNIVHRDIKPDNALIGENGVAKIADVDLCKVLPVDYTTSSMSSSGGAPLYKAPEYYTSPRRYKRSIDVFALGLTIHAVMGDKWVNNKLVPSIKGNKDMTPLIGYEMCRKKGDIAVAVVADHSKISTLMRSENTNLEREMVVQVNKLINRMVLYNEKNRPKAHRVLEDLQKISTLIRISAQGRIQTRIDDIDIPFDIASASVNMPDYKPQASSNNEIAQPEEPLDPCA